MDEKSDMNVFQGKSKSARGIQAGVMRKGHDKSQCHSKTESLETLHSVATSN